MRKRASKRDRGWGIQRAGFVLTLHRAIIIPITHRSFTGERGREERNLMHTCAFVHKNTNTHRPLCTPQVVWPSLPAEDPAMMWFWCCDWRRTERGDEEKEIQYINGEEREVEWQYP